MNMVKYSPFKSLNMWKELDALDSFLGASFSNFDSSPAMDVTVDEKNYCIKADVPGFNKENIKISLDNDILTIEGEQNTEEKQEGKNYLRKERRHCSFKKSVQLYDNVDIDKIKASLKNGILELNIPKKEVKKIEPKKIEVE